LIVSVQVSVYPLGQERLGPSVEAILQAFAREGLEARVGPMSTVVTGDSDRVFAALREGFTRAGRLGPTVLAITVSNACPVAER
jgi:uncharacterized protein YqgV (UPF0045/DUF77 family)